MIFSYFSFVLGRCVCEPDITNNHLCHLHAYTQFLSEGVEGSLSFLTSLFGLSHYPGFLLDPWGMESHLSTVF